MPVAARLKVLAQGQPQNHFGGSPVHACSGAMYIIAWAGIMRSEISSLLLVSGLEYVDCFRSIIPAASCKVCDAAWIGLALARQQLDSRIALQIREVIPI